MTSIALEQLLREPGVPEMAEKLAHVREGWYTNPDLGHRVAGGDPNDRATFYGLVTALAEAGHLECITALHNGRPMRIIHIQDSLADLFGRLS